MNLPENLSIGQACSHIIDYRGKTPVKSKSGVRLITAKVVKGGRILSEPAEYIAENYYDEWMRRGLPQQWDVLVTTEAPCGETANIRTLDRFALGQRLILLRGNPQLIDQRYLLYAMQSSYVQHQIATRATGTTVHGIKQSELRKVLLPVFSLSEQRHIAFILSAYDDLLEVNRQRVEILEEMARRLFEEWFVHLRFPGHEAVTLRDTPDGSVPEGWTPGLVGDLLTLHRGYDLATTVRQRGEVPVMTGSGRNGTHDTAKVAGPGVVTGRSGTVGQVFLIHEDFWPLNTALYVSAYKNTTPVFALFLLRTLKLQAHAGGAAVPTLNRNHVHALPTLCPPADLIQRFDSLVTPMLEAARVLELQSIALATARDLLLPYLLSGQLSIATAERELEAAE